MKQNRGVKSKASKVPEKKPHRSPTGRAQPKPAEMEYNDKHGRSLLAQDAGRMPYGMAMEKRLAVKRGKTRT